jgi:hypothetical protein
MTEREMIAKLQRENRRLWWAIVALFTAGTLQWLAGLLR